MNKNPRNVYNYIPVNVSPEEFHKMRNTLNTENVTNATKWHVIFDFDGTIVSGDPELCAASNEAKKNGIMICSCSTGRLAGDRLENRGESEMSFANTLSEIVASGGAEYCVEIAPGVKDVYVWTFDDGEDMLNKIARAMEKPLEEVIGNHEITIHFVRNGKIYVGVPYPKEKEEKLTPIVKAHGGLVEAYMAGALDDEEALPIREYEKRGMPWWLIEYLPPSEIPQIAGSITQFTVVSGELEKFVENFEKEGIELALQRRIKDREEGSRGAMEGIHPDISDIQPKGINKGAHLKAIAEDPNTITVVFGDQWNDRPIAELADYVFITTPQFKAGPETLSFAIYMAELAKAGKKVAFVMDLEDGTLGNRAAIELLNAKSEEEARAVCEKWVTSEENHKIIDTLLAMKN